jgi:hypothetical protein
MQDGDQYIEVWKETNSWWAVDAWSSTNLNEADLIRTGQVYSRLDSHKRNLPRSIFLVPRYGSSATLARVQLT